MDDAQRSMSNMPVLDLSGVRSREEVTGLRLENIGAVLVPEELPDLLATVSSQNIGAVIPVPKGFRVETRVGNVELSGEALAAGEATTVLQLVGNVTVTSPVTQVGYRGLILVGVVMLPKSAMTAMAGKVITQVGQVVYYEGENPRVFMDDVRLTKAFFDLIEEPIALLLIGDPTFGADVTPELLRAKVRSMAVIGDVTLENADLLALIQFLAKPLVGSVTVRD